MFDRVKDKNRFPKWETKWNAIVRWRLTFMCYGLHEQSTANYLYSLHVVWLYVATCVIFVGTKRSRRMTNHIRFSRLNIQCVYFIHMQIDNNTTTWDYIKWFQFCWDESRKKKFNFSDLINWMKKSFRLRQFCGGWVVGCVCVYSYIAQNVFCTEINNLKKNEKKEKKNINQNA